MKIQNKLVLSALAVAVVIGTASASNAQTVTSTINVADMTTNPASIDTNGANGGCTASDGIGTPLCSPPPPNTIGTGTPSTYLATYTPTGNSQYNTLYAATVELYVDENDPGGQPSYAGCSWRIQMSKSLQLGTWSPTVTISSSSDTYTPFVPSCTDSNLTWNSSTGQYSIKFIFGGGP